MKTQRQLTIMALGHAIQWERSYMESIANCLEDDSFSQTFAQCKKNIEEYKKLRDKLIKKEQK
jgi:hypothetical protein